LAQQLEKAMVWRLATMKAMQMVRQSVQMMEVQMAGLLENGLGLQREMLLELEMAELMARRLVKQLVLLKAMQLELELEWRLVLQ